MRLRLFAGAWPIIGLRQNPSKSRWFSRLTGAAQCGNRAPLSMALINPSGKDSRAARNPCSTRTFATASGAWPDSAAVFSIAV